MASVTSQQSCQVQREAGWAELHGLFSLESSSWPAAAQVGEEAMVDQAPQPVGSERPRAAAPPLSVRSAQLHGDAACS